jgi:hypothetical protein
MNSQNEMLFRGKAAPANRTGSQSLMLSCSLKSGLPPRFLNSTFLILNSLPGTLQALYHSEASSRTRHGSFLDNTPKALARNMTTNGRNHCSRKKDATALPPRVSPLTTTRSAGIPAGIVHSHTGNAGIPAGQLKPPSKPHFAIFTGPFTGFLPLFNRCNKLCTNNIQKFTTFYRYFFFDPGGGGPVKARETSCERFLKGLCDLENFDYEQLAKIQRF